MLGQDWGNLKGTSEGIQVPEWVHKGQVTLDWMDTEKQQGSPGSARPSSGRKQRTEERDFYVGGGGRITRLPRAPIPLHHRRHLQQSLRYLSF